MGVRAGQRKRKNCNIVTFITSSLKLWLISQDSGPLGYQLGVRFFIGKNAGPVATCTEPKSIRIIWSFEKTPFCWSCISEISTGTYFSHDVAFLFVLS